MDYSNYYVSSIIGGLLLGAFYVGFKGVMFLLSFIRRGEEAHKEYMETLDGLKNFVLTKYENKLSVKKRFFGGLSYLEDTTPKKVYFISSLICAYSGIKLIMLKDLFLTILFFLPLILNIALYLWARHDYRNFSKVSKYGNFDTESE